MTNQHARQAGRCLVVPLLALLSAGCSSQPGLVPGTSVSSAGTSTHLSNVTVPLCTPAVNAGGFDSTPIAAGSYLWFWSATSAPRSRAMSLRMTESVISFRSGSTRYHIEGPNMRFSAAQTQALRFRYERFRDRWHLGAPSNTTGSDFLNGIAYRLPHRLPGGITDVKWSAEFYSPNDRDIDWEWAAAVYTDFGNTYGKLRVKPLDDSHYAPYNTDPAGTPEAYKSFVTHGATEGTFGSPIEIVPCRS